MLVLEHEVYLGLQTSSNGRPHVVDGNNDVTLHAHTQRENYLALLDPVFSGDCVKNVVILAATRFHDRQSKNVNILVPPHPLILLCSSEDLRLADEDVAEWPTAAALLVEAGDGTHGEGFDHQGLGVGEIWLL